MKINLINKIKASLRELEIICDEVMVERIKNKTNGDFSSNIAMKLAKSMHKSPMDIANDIIKHINMDDIEKIEIASPGFINFYIKPDYLIKNIDYVISQSNNYGRNEIGKGRKINIEFVSANPTGIIHLGNARGGAYGDSLARILSFSGFDVTKEYYINDAGNQIDNLALSIKARYDELNGLEASIPENGYFGKEIVEIAKKIKKDHDKDVNDIDIFKQAGVDYLVDRIKQDLHTYRIDYDTFTSEKVIRKKYDLNSILDDLNKKGYIYEEDGAKWFKCSELFDDKDHVLQKADGTYTYLMPDIAYHIDKYSRGYDRMIDVLGTDHHGYVNRLKSSIKAMGLDPNKLEVKLLQLVRLVKNNEVVKMSKRSGKSITLNDLIEEVGVNAARYYFSKNSLDTQMDFDLDLAKEKSNENPVYYVSYAYARICSILNSYTNEKDKYDYNNIHDEITIGLLEKIDEFKEVVVNAAKKELPHLITNYVYELSSIFHSYYDKVRVITDDKVKTATNIRILMATKITINNALNLIGVIPPERM